MKFVKAITVMVLCIAVLSLVASIYGVFSSNDGGQKEFKSLRGETIELYGKGLYQNDSVAAAAQGIAQDIVTMVLAIPVLLISLFISRKGSLKGRLLLAGTLGYFLYTYVSYAFLWMYNSLFLVYTVLVSMSLFAFVLIMMSFDLEKLSSCFQPKMPVKFVGGFLIVLGGLLSLMWLGRIVPPLMNGTVPYGLEHYTTLVIQAMDLGFIVPTAVLSGIMVLKRKPFGYLLASVVTMKGLTLGTALTAMIISQVLAGVKISFVEMLIFPIFNLVVIYCMFRIMKSIKEPGAPVKRSNVHSAKVN